MNSTIIWQNKSATISILEKTPETFSIEVTTWNEGWDYPQSIIKHLSRGDILDLAFALTCYTKNINSD